MKNLIRTKNLNELLTSPDGLTLDQVRDMDCLGNTKERIKYLHEALDMPLPNIVIAMNLYRACKDTQRSKVSKMNYQQVRNFIRLGK